MKLLKVLFGFSLLFLPFIVKATELYCELDANTPAEFTFHIPRIDYVVLIKVEKESVKSFGSESIKKVERYPLYYSIDFMSGGSAYLNRESLHLIYFNTSMMRAGLGGFYGNSRDSGADYKCRLVSRKI
jgi:hypothetical protein